MSTRLKEKIEKIEAILERLAHHSNQGVPIVVEGQNDLRILEKLAINSKIIPAKTRESFLTLLTELEESNQKEVILLMDFDNRGKEWTKRLTQYLEQTEIKPNTYFWRKLRRLVSRDVKDIEGIVSYLDTLKKKSGNSQTIIKGKP